MHRGDHSWDLWLERISGGRHTLPRPQATGEVAEWSNAPVLKTGVGQPTVGSNPTLSAITPAQLVWVGVMAL